MNKELVEKYKNIHPSAFEADDLAARAVTIETFIKQILKDMFPKSVASSFSDLNETTKDACYRNVFVKVDEKNVFLLTIIPFKRHSKIKKEDAFPIAEAHANKLFLNKSNLKHVAIHFCQDVVKDDSGNVIDDRQAVTGKDGARGVAMASGFEFIRWDVFVGRLLKLHEISSR